jgi:hypothetical protein
MINYIHTQHLWSLRIAFLGLAFILENKKAKFYGNLQGWRIDLCLRKNTIL